MEEGQGQEVLHRVALPLLEALMIHTSFENTHPCKNSQEQRAKKANARPSRFIQRVYVFRVILSSFAVIS